MFQSHAQEMEMTRIGKSSRGVTREDTLKEAANLHIKLGNVQRYCELMVELGQVCCVHFHLLHSKPIWANKTFLCILTMY